MSRNTSNKSTTSRKSSSPLLTGILVGMVIGVAMAAALAWFLLRSPSPFVAQEAAVANRLPSVVEPAPVKVVATPRVVAASATSAASSVDEAKPRFEFYKVLTDKQDATIVVPPKVDKPVAKEAKIDAKLAKPDSKPDAPSTASPPSAANKEPYYLQAGSFSNAEDAEKLKAKLTLVGMEVSVATATIPDKGVWHRVRVGPFSNLEELNRANATLKQNGITATQNRTH